MTHPSPGQLCPVLGHRLGIDARAAYGVTGPPPATALGGPSSRRYGAGIADPDTAAAAGRVSQAGRPSRSARTSWRAGVWRFRPVPPPRVARVSSVAAVGGCRLVLPDLPRPAEEVLAWAVREGITNVLRHSQATACSVTAARRDGMVWLEIVNDGARPPAGAGTGLAGLAERARALSGSAAGGYTRSGRFRLLIQIPEEAA